MSYEALLSDLSVQLVMYPMDSTVETALAGATRVSHWAIKGESADIRDIFAKRARADSLLLIDGDEYRHEAEGCRFAEWTEWDGY